MTRDRWAALLICLGITLFSVGVGIKFGLAGFGIGFGAVLMFLGMAVLIP